MSKQDIRNRIAAARGQSQSPAANHAARPAQHQAQTTGGAAGTSLRSRDIASRIEAARAKRIQELAASQTGLRRDTAARDDAGARDRFAQRHPEYTGGEAGAANRARNSEKVLRQAAEAAALGEGAKRLNKSENGFGGQDTRRGSVTGLFEQKDSSGGYPGFGGNAATDLRSPNGYVSMADLNAKTNGTSYPGVQGGTTVNGGESALSAELSGLKWDAEDSGKRVEQGIQAMEELAENYGTVQEDGSLAFYNQAAYEAYQKLLEGTLDAQEKQAAALQAYNRQWKTELWEGMSNEDKGQLLSRALQAGQDESGLIPDTGETRPGKSVLTETLESLAAGGNEAASSILRHPTDNAAAFQEKLTPEFVTEQLYRRDMEATDREIAELEAQRDGMTMYTYDQRGDAGQRMAEEHRQAVADIDAKLDALRGEQYYTQAHLDLAKLDAETVEMVMQVPKWKDQRALNAGYESGDEFGGEAGAALHLELAEEAQANLEATETALRDRGLSDREIERLYDIAQREYNYEQTMNMREALSQAATQNFASGALLTAASVPMNLASGVGFIEQAVRKLKNEFGNDYVPLDDFSPMMQGYHGSNAIRGGIADRLDNGKWTGKALSFLYQTGASMLDSAATAAITAATGLPASVLLGGSAATNGMMEAKERGATDSQAIWIGLVSGVAEALFEKVSIDRLLGEVEPESVRALVRNMVTQAFTEGTEEVNTTIANTIADAIIMGDKSAIQTVKREYMAQGMDEGAAYRKAMLDAMQGLLLDFAGGALSGGLMSAAHGAAIYNQAGYQAETSPAMERVPGSVNEAVIGQKNSDADSGVIVYSGNSALDRPTGLAYTLASNRDQISDMSPVKALTGTEMNAKSKKPSEQIREFFAKIGNKVFRPSFGEVSLNEYGVGGMLNHRPLNRAKMVTLTAVPEVIENGRIIAETENWKNRGYKSIVFAAPVTINGKTVYVAAVVDQRPDNKFYLSECVDSEGNFVRIKESPTGDAKSGVTAQGGFTTTPDGGSLETINTSHPQEGKISGYKPSASKRAPATVDGTQSASNQTSETSSGPTLSVDSVPQSQAQYNPNFNQNQGGNTGSPAGRAGTQQAVRKATGYGEYGVKAFSELMDASPGMTFDQLRSQFQSAYELGLTDMPTERARLTTDIQRIAFNAGKQDYIMSSAKAAENSKYVKVWSKGGGLVENDYAKALEAKTADTLNTIGKATGTKIIMEEIPAEQNANGYYQASDGTIHIDVNTTDPVMTVVKHELTHRMQALAPKEYRQFRDYAVQTMSEYGWSKDGSHTAVESQQHAYRDASGGKVSLDTESAMDEMAANFTEKILTDEDALRSFVEHVTKTEEHRTMGQKFFQAVREFIDKLKRIFQGDKAKMDAAAQEQFGATIDQLEKAEALWKEAYRAAEKHAQELSGKEQKSTARAGGVQYSLDADFSRKLDEWIQSGKKGGGYFRIGTTSDALQSIGVKDYTMYWDRNKIAKIMKEHPSMTSDVIKSVPSVLEHPVLVMQSQTVANRITMFGETVDADGKPVLVAVELSPKNKRGEVMDFSVIASAYGKNNAQRLIDTSDILYVDPNKNRTNTWLEALRLQLPAGLTKYGSIASIFTVNRDVNGKISFGETGGKTSMQEAFEKAKKAQKSTARAGGVQYSLNADFGRQIDAWDGKRDQTFHIGTTSDALKSIGVAERDIIWHSRKINAILQKHRAMTRDIIKQVPGMLENPIAVLKSQQSDTRLSIFGEVVDASGAPVTAILELQPTNKGGRLLNLNVVASAYGKDSNPARFIEHSDVLYLDPNQNRTNGWLQGLGLQLPSDTTAFGSIGSVTYQDGNVKIVGVPYRQLMQDSGKNAQELSGKAQKSTARAGGVQYSLKTKYDYSVPFAQQVDDYQAGKIDKTDTLVVGPTPEVFRKIGFNALPMTINSTHVDYALYGTKDADHALGTAMLKQLPEALKSPVAVFASQTQSGTSVVALLELVHNGKQVITPITIDGYGFQNSVKIDSNAITSAFAKGNAVTKLLHDAIQAELDGKVSLFYLDQNKTAGLLQKAGLQLPGFLFPTGGDTTGLLQNRGLQLPPHLFLTDGYIHSIRDKGSPVNTKLENVTESQQFKRWFGDWQNKPNTASKVVDEDGKPRVVYHGTAEDIHSFDQGRGGSLTRAADAKEGFFFTSSQRAAEGYAEAAMPRELLALRDEFDRLESLWGDDPELDRQYREARDAYERALTAYRETGGGRTVPVYLNIRNPVVVDFAGASYQGNAGRVEAAIAQAKRDGNDGVILQNILDPLGPRELRETADEYIVFRSEQVKSATENIGTFDRGNPDIRYSLKGQRELMQQYMEQYGIIPEGETPHRKARLPKKTGENQRVSQTVRTAMEAKVTPDEAIPDIESLVADGSFSYEAITDKQAIQDADGTIRRNGWDASLRGWFDSVKKGEVSKANTALGWALYNNAANSGNIQTALDILQAMAGHQRSAAQALQATRILKRLSPETQLYQVQRSVESLQEELNSRYGKKNKTELKVSEELAGRFMEAKTQTERDEILKDIYRDIGRQMPASFIDKWNAWRYLAMLGNVRTHVRNVVGNAGFVPAVGIKNATATAIEAAVHRVSGGRLNRSKAAGTFTSKAGRALLKAAWSDFDHVQEIAMSGGKYSDFANANRYIEEGRRIFRFKPLEAARKGNSKLLDLEDAWFSRPHYAYAMAQYCRANSITAEQLAGGKAIEPARRYAIHEAQKATYRDTNAFSQMVSGWGRGASGTNAAKKAFNAAVEGILPFRKTPANILARGVEYSPIGLMKSLSYDLAQVKAGKLTGAEAIDNISAGLTGTGLVALGALLASFGLIRGHGGGDEDKKRFEEMLGHQAYSLELPGGASVTLDWLAPEALPFFIGVNLWEQAGEDTENVTLSEILTAVSTVTEPLLEMSCLQSLNDVFDSVGYASANGLDALPAALASAATSYLTQGLPTILGQAERSGQEVRMTIYTEKNGFLTSDMQYALGSASARMPGWDFNQIPYIDAWGRKETTGSTLERMGNNFLNPAYTSDVKTSKMEEELLRLYDATGERSVFPSRADKYFTEDGARKDLTAEEYVRYATLKGQKSLALLTELTESKQYKELSDLEKVHAIEDAYDMANQQAKAAVSKYKPDAWITKAGGVDTAAYLVFRANLDALRGENDGKLKQADVAALLTSLELDDEERWSLYFSQYDGKEAHEAHDMGIDAGTYLEFKAATSDMTADKDAEGNSIPGTKKEKVMDYMDTMGLTQDEYDALLEIAGYKSGGDKKSGFGSSSFGKSSFGS